MPPSASTDGPRKHKASFQCWFNAGPPSATLAQHWTSIRTVVFVKIQIQSIPHSMHVTQILRKHHTMNQWFYCCWAGVDDGRPALKQHWVNVLCLLLSFRPSKGGGPRVVVSTAAFQLEFGVRFLISAVWKKQKMFYPIHVWKSVGSLRDPEVACLTSDRQGSNLEAFVWRTVSSQSSHHRQEVLLAQFSLYVHKGGLKPD